MHLSPQRTEGVFDMKSQVFHIMNPQNDDRVRALIADGRKMFTHSPLSEKELELLARSVIDAEPNRVGEGDS